MKTRRPLSAGIALAFAVLLPTGMALAAPAPSVTVKPWTYDPDKTGIIVSQWVTKAGLADAGKADHALSLQKNGSLTINAAAGASVTGMEGQALLSLGFDVKVGSYCGAGAPRFNVTASDGFHFMGGCANATPSGAPTLDARGAAWQRYSIDPFNPGQSFPVLTPGATVVSSDIVFDEEGQGLVDNVSVNGICAGQPGRSTSTC